MFKLSPLAKTRCKTSSLVLGLMLSTSMTMAAGHLDAKCAKAPADHKDKSYLAKFQIVNQKTDRLVVHFFGNDKDSASEVKVELSSLLLKNVNYEKIKPKPWVIPFSYNFKLKQLKVTVNNKKKPQQSVLVNMSGVRGMNKFMSPLHQKFSFSFKQLKVNKHPKNNGDLLALLSRFSTDFNCHIKGHPKAKSGRDLCEFSTRLGSIKFDQFKLWGMRANGTAEADSTAMLQAYKSKQRLKAAKKLLHKCAQNPDHVCQVNAGKLEKIQHQVDKDWQAVLDKGFLINLDNLSVMTKQGLIKFNLRVNHAAIDGNSATAGTKKSLFDSEANLSLSVPHKLIVDLVSQYVMNKASKGDQRADNPDQDKVKAAAKKKVGKSTLKQRRQQAEMFIKIFIDKGYIKKDGKNLTVNVEFKQNKITVNGQKMDMGGLKGLLH